MSSLSSVDADVLFRMRADRETLQQDLRSMQADIEKFAAMMKDTLARAGGAGLTADFKLPPDVVKQFAEIDRQMQALQKDTEAAASSMRAVADEADAAAASVGGITEQADAAAESTKGLANSMDQVGNATEKATAGALRLGAAYLIARAAAKSLEVTADSIELGKAIKSGDLGTIEEKKAVLKKDLESFPLAGEIAKQGGRVADEMPYETWLGDARQYVRDNSSQRKTKNASGTMSDDEIEAFDKAQAKLKEKLDATAKAIVIVEQQNRQAQAITRQAGRVVAREGRSSVEVADLQARNQLEDFNREIADRPAGTKLTADEKDARAALQAGVVSADDRVVSTNFEKTKKAVEGFVTDFASHIAKANNAGLKAQSELQEAQERANGEVDEAEKTHLEQSIAEKRDAAKKIGDYQVQIVEQVAQADRDALDRTQAIRRQKKEHEADDDYQRAKKLTDDSLRVLEDAGKKRVREIGDIVADTREKSLRRNGQGAEADVDAILHRTVRAVNDANDDAEKIHDIVANAQEDILGVRANQRQNAEVIDASSASRMNLLDGTSNDDDRWLTLQQEAVDTLKKLERKLPGVAVTGP